MNNLYNGNLETLKKKFFKCRLYEDYYSEIVVREINNVRILPGLYPCMLFVHDSLLVIFITHIHIKNECIVRLLCFLSICICGHLQ